MYFHSLEDGTTFLLILLFSPPQPHGISPCLSAGPINEVIEGNTKKATNILDITVVKIKIPKYEKKLKSQSIKNALAPSVVIAPPHTDIPISNNMCFVRVLLVQSSGKPYRPCPSHSK